MTWHRPRTAVTLIVLSLLCLGAAPAFADSGTFSTDSDLVLNGTGQSGPTTVPVSGMNGKLTSFTVTLTGVTMNAMCADILLVAPDNDAVLLMSDVQSSVTGVTWTYSDNGEAQPMNAPSTSDNAYAPALSHSSCSGENDSFVSPAPTAANSPNLGGLTGGNPNGAWTLYIHDDQDAGTQLIGGWSLTLHTSPDVDPASKDFGSVVAGTTSSSQTFTVANSGGSDINLTGAHIGGANAGEFAIASNNCPGALAPENSCSLSVVFQPTSGGAKTASLLLDETTTIPLSGTGLVPQLQLSPANIDFGEVQLGTPMKQFVTVTNGGTATLSLTLPASPSTNDFTISIQDVAAPDTACGGSLAPGQSCKFEVLFTPITVGTKGATITFIDNAPGGPHAMNLSGIAVAAPVGLPPVVQSGSQDIKVESVTFSSPPTAGQRTTLDVTASDKSAAVVGISVDFGESLGLYAASGCVKGLNKGDSETFSVPYKFLSPGQHTITITVYSGGCNKPDAHVYVVTVDVASPKAARRIAHSSVTLSGPDITTKCKDANLQPTTKNGKRIVKSVLCIINEQRKLVKLKPYKLNKKLTKSALNHTRAMIAGKFFAHQGPREPALGSRFKKVKYRFAGGENIGAGAGQLGSPLMMVNGWMHSSLHKANLLSKQWRVVGIGFIAQYPIPTASKPVATYTVNFGSK